MTEKPTVSMRHAAARLLEYHFGTLFVLAAGCAFISSLLALTAFFSAEPLAAGAWYLDVASLVVLGLIPAVAAIVLACFGPVRRSVHIPCLLVLAPVSILLAAGWGFWNLLPELLLLTGVAAVACVAALLEAQNGPVLTRSAEPARACPPAAAQPDAHEQTQQAIALPAGLPVGDDYEIDHEQATEHFEFVKQWTGIDFQSVAGMETVKRRLREAAQEAIAPRAAGERARNGILLFGEPGNGKTFFAEALAGELGLGMVRCTFGDVNSKWVGSTTEQVVRVFRDAVAQAPCVLFIDEIDSLIRDRYDNANASEESARTTNTLLTEIVALRAHPIVLVAATNHLDKLDAAAIREGRFDFKIEITPPDATARRALIAHALTRHTSLSIEEAALERAIRRWDGFSVARISSVIDSAMRTALRQGRQVLDYPTLQLALRETQGRAGRLPADTPALESLALSPALARQLLGVAHRMRHADEAERRGGTVPTGLLFQGPPGTGKTLAARALAKSTGWAFLETSGSELLGRPERIGELLREARDIRPCIVFLDEADDVLLNRAANHPHGVSVTNRLLGAIDGAGGPNHDLLWIAATNAPHKIDEAAMRGGRFSVKIDFEAPDRHTLGQVIAQWRETSPAVFAENCGQDALIDALFGLTMANVVAVLQQAANLAVDRALCGGDERVCVHDVQEARAQIAQD